MSDPIKHECGIALLRLLKPLDFYINKYGTAFFGINKMYLLMEKQHNRGQDGAGLASVKLDVPPGIPYINIKKSNSATPIQDIFLEISKPIKEISKNTPERMIDTNWLKKNLEFFGDIFLGHLRYGTFGKNQITNCHPFHRESYWKTRNLIVAGNFNLTNVDELFTNLVNTGQHPVDTSDTITILEKICHFLDEENDKLVLNFKKSLPNRKDVTQKIIENINLSEILTKASKNWDGGFVIAGILGHGDAFVLRDPCGIRPAYYFVNDEIAVVTSERPVIQTVFGVSYEQIKELDPGHAFIIKHNGVNSIVPCIPVQARKACSFERIYFSRGTDAAIYKERKNLGKFLCKQILDEVNWDFENTVFSYVPNTASVAFFGLNEELHKACESIKLDKILQAGSNIDKENLKKILSLNPRFEAIAVKDAKLRTFITQDNRRDDLVAHVYDTTYGAVREGKDNLVILDDSIVRGTTLKQSIIRILDRLGPVKIVIVSSAPQIRYPDCYGIDMARLGDLVAFRAAIELLKETNQEKIINQVYKKSKEQEGKKKEEIVNYVKEIYKPFTPQQIADKIAQLLTPTGTNAKIKIIFQTIENLHLACPNHKGDWYFTGDYPTPGGNKVVNKAFINYIEGKNERAY